MRIDIDKGLIIKKSIMHILDNKSGKKELSDFEMNLDSKTEKLITRHVINSVNDEYVRLAKFEGSLNVVQLHCQAILDNEKEFISKSTEIANFLYDLMEKDKRISPAYAVISIIKYEEVNYISLLKLDFNVNLTSKIFDFDGKKRIDIVEQGMGLPNENQKLHKCIFYIPDTEIKDYDIILLDKQTRGEGEVTNFFANNFLHCRLAITDRDNTKNFNRYTNLFIEDKFKDDLEKTSELKERINATLKSDVKINIAQFAEATFGEDEELVNEFIDFMTEKTIDVDFKIDKQWVEKNIKRRKFITDTGIEIKIDDRTVSDAEKFAIEYPYEDKSKANIIIKNVTYQEKLIK